MRSEAARAAPLPRSRLATLLVAFTGLLAPFCESCGVGLCPSCDSLDNPRDPVQALTLRPPPLQCSALRDMAVDRGDITKIVKEEVSHIALRPPFVFPRALAFRF